MDYAIALPFGGQGVVDGDWVCEFARHAESCGFESLVAAEHSVMVSGTSSRYPYSPTGRLSVAADSPVPDPLELLSYLAACTTRIGLATGVLILPNHHPVVLAKRAATLDTLSRGRLRLCVGVGWLREEIEACGADFATRGRRAAEQVEVMRVLWADTGPEGAAHEGEFFRFRGALCRPGPWRATGVPVHFGGHSTAAARRAGRYGEGFQPLGVDEPELLRLIGVMRREAQRYGRDPDALEVTLYRGLTELTEQEAARLAALGVHRIVLQVGEEADLERLKDRMSVGAERLVR
ncbi:LLM class F420-dependent oxidoreductase [Streptomyces cellostaticus]|uniref:LLM class F420-dependent oxidoreductase n=1 Tax=Streptomyces cellostaticus TaxID=67285 RepID=A0A117PU28_9ACTN|nr:LLM class F420-dependent oxidoreductase [Streptomyces cellostaticus]KUM92133.1 LLM class F420-dependent oxidoreductase [Streptomyces cellostaticus]